jgi:putative transposase
MDEEQRSKIATFRFSVIADFVNGQSFARGQKAQLMREKTEREWVIPFSEKTRIAKGTILLWINLYEHGGGRLDSLKPRTRADKGQFRAISDELKNALLSLKATNKDLTLPAMLEKLGSSVLGDAHLSTLYRFLSQEFQEPAAASFEDKRKFEVEHPNQLWQCDVLHGPLVKMPQGPMKKSYLIAIIDDHSRLVTHAQFYLSETLESLKDCIRQAIELRGLPVKFYVDNGACYRAGNLEHCLASLGISLSHSKPYVPQGRGKIERWFGTVRLSFLPVYADRPLTLPVLNERLEIWVDKYNSTQHSTTKEVPYDRHRKSLSCVRPAPKDLLDFFRHSEERKVRKDRTIQIHSQIYEVPLGLIDHTVEVRFHEAEPDKMEVFFQGRSYGEAKKLNAVVNSRLGREGQNQHKKATVEIKSSQPAISSGELFGGQ